MPRETRKEVHHSSGDKALRRGWGIGSLLLRQVIAAAVCFAVVYGMQGSGNTYLNNYAASLGRALRYDANFEQVTRNAAEWIKERFLPIIDKEEEAPALPDGVTFQ